MVFSISLGWSMYTYVRSDSCQLLRFEVASGRDLKLSVAGNVHNLCPLHVLSRFEGTLSTGKKYLVSSTKNKHLHTLFDSVRSMNRIES